MIHGMSSNSRDERLFDRASAPFGRGAPKKTPNKGYGKYAERYQYVTRFSLGCHGTRLASLSDLSTNGHRNRIRFDRKAVFPTCENVLRNDLILQQVCAC